MNSFEHLLEDGEKVIREIRPKKTPTQIGSWVMVSILLLMTVVCVILPFVIPASINEETFPFFIIAGMWFIGAGIGTFVTLVSFDKYLYCITDKKIIIRSGIIGIDFRVMELDSITTVDLITGLSDKLCGYKTSTIAFYNASNSAVSSGQQVGYKKNAFLHIENANQVYKEVKELIKNAKDSK